MLRAPAAEIAGIAATHGLTVLDEIDVSQDALGRLLYLVEAAPEIDPAQVIADVLAMEPEAAGMERAVLASVPESFLNASNTQDTSGLAALQADDTEILFGDDGDGDSDANDRPVWQGYVDQPAANLINVPLAQEQYKGDATVAIIDTGIDPNHPLLAEQHRARLRLRQQRSPATLRSGATWTSRRPSSSTSRPPSSSTSRPRSSSTSRPPSSSTSPPPSSSTPTTSRRPSATARWSPGSSTGWRPRPS